MYRKRFHLLKRVQDKEKWRMEEKTGRRLNDKKRLLSYFKVGGNRANALCVGDCFGGYA
jgi:hypothetical protein